MALNAILIRDERPAWGRSYMEHVVAVCDDATVPESVRAASRQLRDTAPEPPALVKLGSADRAVQVAAGVLLEWARQRVAALSSDETGK